MLSQTGLDETPVDGGREAGRLDDRAYDSAVGSAGHDEFLGVLERAILVLVCHPGVTVDGELVDDGDSLPG